MRKQKCNHVPMVSIKCGNAIIKESTTHTILGVEVSNTLKWCKHEDKIRNTLRQRIGLLRKLSFNLPRDCLLELFDGMVLSTVRYCIPLYCQAVTQGNSTNPTQILLNNAMRAVLGVRRSDRESIEELLKRLNTMSYNQVGIQAMLTLTWQIQKGTCQGLRDFFKEDESHTRVTKASVRGDIKCSARTSFTQNTFRYRAAMLWNSAPLEVRNLNRTTLPHQAIKDYARSCCV